MMKSRNLYAALFLLLLCGSFAFGLDLKGIEKKVKDGTLFDGAAQVQGLDAEFDRYRRQAESLKKHFDTGGFDEHAMLKVLRNEGVFAIGGQKSYGTGFRPFKVRVYGGLWRWPLRAGVVSSEFGRRWGKQHEGIDIAADSGVPVTASADGMVLYCGHGLRGYGNVVIVRHDQKTTTLYAHNQSILVSKGDQVRAGQMIARLGATGHSTGPHVHFEIRRQGRAVDPRRVLVKSRF